MKETQHQLFWGLKVEMMEDMVRHRLPVRSPKKREDHVPPGDPCIDHMSKGEAGDGVIYLNDDGETATQDIVPGAL